MIELFLDNKPAVLAENVSIKLTRENVYFTKSGSYTYDIELPLQCSENRAIFGSINRKDVITQAQEFSALLRVDNVVLLDGKAVINNVTESSVKVQLLGGNSEMNFYAKGEELYIDELDLGDWINYEMTPEPFGSPTTKGSAMTREWIDWDLGYSNNQPQSDNESEADASLSWWKKRWWAYTPEDPHDSIANRGVAFPIINKNSNWNDYCSSGLLCNEVVMRKHGSKYYPEYRMSWGLEWPSVCPQICPSFQPMLCRTLRKILKVVGYPVEDAESLRILYESNNLYPRIFIACANNRREIAKALPHWTVNEFITQIEHFLGIVIDVNDITKKSHVINRSQWWNDSSPTVINDVVDEYSVDVDKENTTDISNGNVGFADVEDGMAHISDEIMEVAIIDDTTFSSMYEMNQYIANGASDSDKNKIFVVDGHQFILCYDKTNAEYSFKEVNQLRPLIRKTDTKNIDIELKIVPALTVEQKVAFVSTTKIGTKWFENTIGEGTVNIIIVEDRSNVGAELMGEVTTDKDDLQALIEGTAEIDKASEIDKMYVGVVPDDLYPITGVTSGTGTPITGYYPRVFPFPRHIINGTSSHNEDPNQDAYISLADYPNADTLANQCIDNGQVVDTTVKYCIKFISNKVMRPTGTFIINNKRFACEKLEYNITEKGISPLVTGYFYRLDD